MAEHQETLIERLIPGDLEHQIPAALERALPGGFKNRIVQAALGFLITFGFAFVVRRMLEKREARQRMLASERRPIHPHAVIPREPSPPIAVGQAMTDTPASPAPAAGPQAGSPAGRALRYPLLAEPHIVLSGPVDHAMYANFSEQLKAAPHEGPLVVAISTLGGDPEVARLMADDIRMLREYQGRETLFLGKVTVYSAGATFMAGFPADKRFLTHGTRIMIHERQINTKVTLAGPLKMQVASLKAKLHEIEESVRIEEEGFRDLVAGTRITFDEVRQRAPANWYIEAIQARNLGLVLDVI